MLRQPNETLINTDKLVGSELQAAIAAKLRDYFLELDYSKAMQPADLKVITLSLEGNAGISTNVATMSAENPNGYKIEFPFTSVYVADATDAQANVRFVPGTTQVNSNLGLNQNALPLSLKDSVHLQSAQQMGLLIWPSQPGKTITLVFSINSKIFSGSQVQLVSGGVSVSNGSSIDQEVFGALGTSGRLPVTPAVMVIVPANSLRKVARFQVTGGDIRLGTASLTVTPGSETGMLLTDGSFYEFRNTGALYAFAQSGTPIITGTQET